MCRYFYSQNQSIIFENLNPDLFEAYVLHYLVFQGNSGTLTVPRQYFMQVCEMWNFLQIEGTFLCE